MRIATYVLLLLLLLTYWSPGVQADELYTTMYGGTDGYCGATTASGETFDCGAFTAASNVYPLGTVLSICFDSCATVVVNDRCGGCGLDLSPAAAEATGVLYDGPGVAEITVL